MAEPDYHLPAIISLDTSNVHAIETSQTDPKVVLDSTGLSLPAQDPGTSGIDSIRSIGWKRQPDGGMVAAIYGAHDDPRQGNLLNLFAGLGAAAINLQANAAGQLLFDSNNSSGFPQIGGFGTGNLMIYAGVVAATGVFSQGFPSAPAITWSRLSVGRYRATFAFSGSFYGGFINSFQAGFVPICWCYAATATTADFAVDTSANAVADSAFTYLILRSV